MQTLFWQHPPAQEAALQTHCPPTHESPAPHAAPAPHLQAPPLQVSEVEASHVTQPPPPAPQVVSDGALQTLPAQQPPAQL